MRPLPGLLVSVLVPTAIFAASFARAQERGVDIGVRGNVVAADGEPANDIPGAGLIAHYAIDERWTLGVAVDRSEYDFEEPAKILGIVQDPALEPIDALAEATTISFWVERSITDRPTVLFVGMGLGAAFVDVPGVAGATANGGRFDIHTDVDTELIACVLAGARRHFGQRWYGEVALKAEQHFADWQITDRVSAVQGSVGDYFAYGAHVAVGIRW